MISLSTCSTSSTDYLCILKYFLSFQISTHTQDILSPFLHHLLGNISSYLGRFRKGNKNVQNIKELQLDKLAGVTIINQMLE